MIGPPVLPGPGRSTDQPVGAGLSQEQVSAIIANSARVMVTVTVILRFSNPGSDSVFPGKTGPLPAAPGPPGLRLHGPGAGRGG